MISTDVHPWSGAAQRAVQDRKIVLGPGFGRQGWCALSGIAAQIDMPSGELNAWAVLADFLSDIPSGQAVVGYIGYEAAGALEPSLRLPAGPSGLPMIWAARCENIERLGHDQVPEPIRGSAAVSVHDHTNRAEYCEKVEAVVEAIRRGDIFQANVSRRLEASFHAAETSEAALFVQMMQDGGAPYAAYIPVPAYGATLLSNSPELFMEIDGQVVVTEPIKGTRPRGLSAREDQAIAQGLLSDPKDRAENIMIADLMRNDLAKVCEDFSIREEEICALRTLPYVHHLYSRISGKLRGDLRAIDAVAAAFPCGSITGAPKIRAMEIIAAIEKAERGPYCGTIFYIPGDGPAVFSVAIRTGTVLREGNVLTLSMRFGGGITTLSDPNTEYDETNDKAASFRAMIS